MANLKNVQLLALQNLLYQIDSTFYSSLGFADSGNINGEIKPGPWRSVNVLEAENSCLQSHRVLDGS